MLRFIIGSQSTIISFKSCAIRSTSPNFFQCPQCTSNVEWFPAVHDLKVRVDINGYSNHLEDLASVWGLDTTMIPGSSSWSSVVVSGGKNTTSTFSSSMLMDCRRPGVLSIICKTFNGKPSFSKHSLTSGMKHWWNHSVKNTAVTHALRLCCQKTSTIIFVLESAGIFPHG